MLTFLEAIEKVLQEEDNPLSSKDIYVIGRKKGYIQSEGETPWKTINSKISSSIIKGDSVFMRVAEGVFALKEWNDRFSEYKAQRYVKKHYDEHIATIKKTDLIKAIPFKEEKIIHTKKPFQKSLSPLIFRTKRSEAEQRYDIIQLVSVFIISLGPKILTHMRSARLPESRLHGEYSINLGGHLGIDDFKQLNFNLEGFHDESTSFFLRELYEELKFETQPEIHQVGYIYDESRPVSSQHLGLIYTVYLQDERYRIGEKGYLMNPKLETISEIESRISDFDNWSVALLQQIKKGNINLGKGRKQRTRGEPNG